MGKRKKQKLDVATEARRLARNRAGAPPPERIAADKRRKPPKHKKKELEKELD